MRLKSKIYEQMLLGDSYTNEEAVAMMKHFKLVADSCHELGPRFHFAFREANDQYLKLRDVCKARGICDEGEGD